MHAIPLFALFAVVLRPADAAPLESEPLSKAVLRKIPTVRDGEHPVMAFQRHQESAVKRLHRCTGVAPPDQSVFDAQSLARRQALEEIGELDKRTWYPPVNGQSNGAAAVQASPMQAAASPATTTITAGGDNSNGYSQAELDALNQGKVTDSTSALVDGGLPYNIELNDIGYLIDIEIGTPAQKFTMLADTGSGDTWVPSSMCTMCGQHTSLGSEVSSTFQSSPEPFSVTYGSGSVSGSACADTATIADMKLNQLIFGVTMQESSQFSADSVPFDGLMGLSFAGLSSSGRATPIDQLQSDGLVKEAVLGIALGRVADGENNGELVFGQADTSKFDSSTTQTLPVSSNNGFWQIAMPAVTVNGQDISTNRQAILDTGTSLILAPFNDANAFHAQIQGSKSLEGGMFSIPCTTDAVVTMTFGNAAFQIDARDLVFQPIGNSPTGQCISSVSSGTITDAQTWLLGDAFLKNVYMTTNVQEKTVQLSARTDAPKSSSFGTKNSANAKPDLNSQNLQSSQGSASKRSAPSTNAGMLTAGGLALYFARQLA